MIGAPQPLVLAKPAAIDTAQAARYFGARGEPDDRTMTLLETCAMPLLAAATPRAVWLEADTAALAEAGGYLESSSEYSDAGDSRSVSLTYRVPQQNYENFLAAVAEAGNVTTKTSRPTT